MSRLEEKLKWLREWSEEFNQPKLDVTNTALTDNYSKEFDVQVEVRPIGTPNKCHDLGKTLSMGHDDGTLERKKVNINIPGYPKWVYCYNFPLPPVGSIERTVAFINQNTKKEDVRPRGINREFSEKFGGGDELPDEVKKAISKDPEGAKKLIKKLVSKHKKDIL